MTQQSMSTSNTMNQRVWLVVADMEKVTYFSTEEQFVRLPGLLMTSQFLSYFQDYEFSHIVASEFL